MPVPQFWCSGVVVWLYHAFVDGNMGGRYSLVLAYHLVFNTPLHAARRAMAAALQLPPKATAGFYRYTHLLPPDGPCGVIVGASQRLLLPSSAVKTTHHTPNKTGFLYPYSSISSGVGLTSTSTSALPSIPSWATGVSASGGSALGDSTLEDFTAPFDLHSLRGGGGDFHTLADWRAPFL